MTFFHAFSAIVAKVTSAEVSDMVAFIFSSGSVFALNKDDEDEQKSRIKGSSAQRTTFQGTLVLKKKMTFVQFPQ